ncbi:MAG: class I SAM-dependent DNA methyltransferase [Solirubrobacteraceae bacterium]
MLPAESDQLEDLRLPTPEAGRLAQDQEWCEVCIDGVWRCIRFHEYGALYEIPGLYERLFYDLLECCSPRVIRELLATELDRESASPSDLVVLDLGAGNGMVGEQLADLGARAIVGVDLIEQAAAATERDRPGLYDDYLVADLTQLDAIQRERLTRWRFTGMTTVAALGFDDIPPEAFGVAYKLIEPGGWIAFTIKESFLTATDPSGFERLIRRMLKEGALDLRTQRRYCHRLSSQGHPLYYIAMVAIKSGDLPAGE